MTKRDLDIGRALYPEDTSANRPRTRAECEGGARPCPYVGCKWHLYLDVAPRTGSITMNFPDLEVDEMVETCALDVADRGGETLEEVGRYVNVTRERIRQIEAKAMARSSAGLEELAEAPDKGKARRRLQLVENQSEAQRSYNARQAAKMRQIAAARGPCERKGCRRLKAPPLGVERLDGLCWRHRRGQQQREEAAQRRKAAG